MSFFKSWPFAFWTIVAVVGVGAVAYALVVYDDAPPAVQRDLQPPNDLVFEAAGLVAAAVAGGESVDAKAGEFAALARENADVLRRGGWTSLADGYETLGAYAETLDAAMGRDERVWRADVLARNAASLRAGRGVAITDGQWLGVDDTIDAGVPTARERLDALSGTVAPGG
jgi:hypothetical protein